MVTKYLDAILYFVDSNSDKRKIVQCIMRAREKCANVNTGWYDCDILVMYNVRESIFYVELEKVGLLTTWWRARLAYDAYYTTNTQLKFSPSNNAIMSEVLAIPYIPASITAQELMDDMNGKDYLMRASERESSKARGHIS